MSCCDVGVGEDEGRGRRRLRKGMKKRKSHELVEERMLGILNLTSIEILLPWELVEVKMKLGVVVAS